MKSLIALFVLVSTSLSFAGEKYICKEITKNSYDNKKTMILTQVGHDRVKEGVKYTFTFELFEINNSTPIVSEKVTVETEDVMFNFVNKAKKIEGTIYLDEYDQTSVTIGKKEYRFNCN